jgi:hypothetical protein
LHAPIPQLAPPHNAASDASDDGQAQHAFAVVLWKALCMHFQGGLDSGNGQAGSLWCLPASKSPMHSVVSGLVCADVSMAAPMDPFTGGGAYVPSAAGTEPAPATGAFMDPFTGAGAYVPDEPSLPAQQASGPLPAGLVYSPHREYQGFEAMPNASKVVAKIREFSSAVPAAVALSEDELASGGPVDDILTV